MAIKQNIKSQRNSFERKKMRNQQNSKLHAKSENTKNDKIWVANMCESKNDG